MRFTIDTGAIRSAMKTIASIGKTKESAFMASALTGSVILIPEDDKLHLHTVTGTVAAEVVLHSEDTGLEVEDGGMIGIQTDNLVAALDVQRSSRVTVTYDHDTKYVTVEGAEEGGGGSPQRVTIKTDSAEAVEASDLKKRDFDRSQSVIEVDSDILTSNLLEFTPTSNQDALYGDAITLANVDGEVYLVIREAHENLFLGYKNIPCKVVNDFVDIPVSTDYTRVTCNAIRAAGDDGTVCVNHRLSTHDRQIRFTVVKGDKIYLDITVPQSDAYVETKITAKELIAHSNKLLSREVVANVVVNHAALTREIDAATKVGALSDNLLADSTAPLKNVLFQVDSQEITVASSQEDSRYTGSIATENAPDIDEPVTMQMAIGKLGKFLQGHPFGHQENVNMFLHGVMQDIPGPVAFHLISLTPEGEDPHDNPSGAMVLLAQGA